MTATAKRVNAGEAHRRKVTPALAARIVELHRAGLGPHAIAAKLNAEGIPPARGGEKWYASTVASILDTAGEGPPSGIEPQLARMIVAMRDIDGGTLTSICDALNRARVPSRRGRRWHPATLSRLLPRLRRELAASQQ